VLLALVLDDEAVRIVEQGVRWVFWHDIESRGAQIAENGLEIGARLEIVSVADSAPTSAIPVRARPTPPVIP
jgi:hypothetical protein